MVENGAQYDSLKCTIILLVFTRDSITTCRDGGISEQEIAKKMQKHAIRLRSSRIELLTFG